MTTEPEELRLASALGHICTARAKLVSALACIGMDATLAADITHAQVLLTHVQSAIQAKIARVCRKEEEET